MPLGFLEHHGEELGDELGEELYTLETIRGTQRFYNVDSVVVERPLLEMVSELEFELEEVDRELIIAELRQEVEELEITSTTSYFGAKELARAARLIELARVLGEDELKTEVLGQLKESLVEWFSYDESKENQYFEWDKERGGIIARQEAFGSQDYNDHHFHYGYFLYAAAVVAEEDSEFLDDYERFVDIIAYDIANLDRGLRGLPVRADF